MVGTRLYVGGLPHGVNERDLERFFRGYGRMREVLLKNGYGFVEFDDYRDADDAVYELNGKKILGVRVTVERARGTPRGRDYARDSGSYGSSRGGGGDYYRSNDRGGGNDRYSSGGGGGGGGGAHNDRYGPPTRTKHRLIVENLSTRVSWQDLKDYMRKAGEVTFADAHKKRRNEGIVEFMCHADLLSALDKLDKSELNGRVIRLVEDKSCRSRSYSSSSRSRSRSRRRSRSPDAKDRDRSKSRSRSRSPTPPKKAAATAAVNANTNDRSRSTSRKKSASRSRSRSGGAEERGGGRDNRSRSKSRSYSKERRANSRSKSRSVDN